MTKPANWDRRTVLQSLGLAAGAAAIGAPRAVFADDRWKRGGGEDELLETFYDDTDVRPPFAWMNREDVLYHDMDMPSAVAESPEYCSLLRAAVWVFNRQTQWVRQDGTILCYDAGGDLWLTGSRQASAWHTGPANSLANDGDFTLFSKASRRRRDGAVIPSFQFRQDQHPVLDLEVTEADADWQVCITPKGRGGIPLIATAWHQGPGKISIDIAQELGNRGLDWVYPELHIAIGTWTQNAQAKARVRFRMHAAGRPAVAACLPVIRTEERARAGVTVTAVVLDAAGGRLGAGQVRVSAVAGTQQVSLNESDGVWRGTFKGLAVGDHRALIRAEGAVSAETACELRVTDGQFLAFNRSQPWVTRNGQPLGPLTGSYQGTFFFRHAGEPGERMVQGQAQWDAWDRSAPDSEHMHFWESLSENEFDERFRFLKESNFDLTTLHSHWGDWERLDGGGRIAPHGAEQLARYLRVASRYGLKHVQALASGPYGLASQKPGYGGTVPYSVYLDAGFQTAQFMTPGSSFDALYHQYLNDFALLFRDETALFAMTSAGEGDHYVGAARTNDSMHQIRALDKHHVFLAETVLMMKQLPQGHDRGFEQDGFGSRTYFIGTHYAPEADLGVHFKFLNMDGLYLAEGSWPPMPSYIRFQSEVLNNDKGSPLCWTGTQHYRTRLRDTLYLGLVHLLPIINTWDEEFTEDEHRVFAQVRALIDWRQNFARPRLAILVDDACANVDDPHYATLIEAEAALSRLGIGYRLAAKSAAKPTDVDLVIDGAAAPVDLRYRAQGGILPDSLRNAVPLTVSTGYSASHVASQDGGTLLAYVYNTSRHERRYYWLGGNLHRSPRPVPLTIELSSNFKKKGRARVYDLNTKQLIDDSPAQGSGRFEVGQTDHDYFVVLTPN